TARRPPRNDLAEVLRLVVFINDCHAQTFIALSLISGEATGLRASNRENSMPQVSKYETVAQSFLDAHPLGQMVTATSLLEWANSHGDGLRADLALDDPGKQINAIKRHLNEGGASPNISEDRRYYVDVEDPKRKTFVVRPYAEYVKDQAISAFGKSVTGALSP